MVEQIIGKRKDYIIYGLGKVREKLITIPIALHTGKVYLLVI